MFSSIYKNFKTSPDINIFSILVCLLPIALITGPAIPDIIISLTALFFLIKSFYKKFWSYYQNPIVYGIIIFCIYSIFRSLTSDLPLESLKNEGSIFYFRYLFFGLAIWHLLDNNPNLSKLFFSVSIISLIIVICDGFYQYFTGTNILGYKKFSDYRLTGLFGDEPIIGRYISYLSIFSFFLYFQIFKTNRISIALSILLLVVCEVTVFITGERSPLFSLVLFSVLLLIFAPYFRIYRILGVGLSAIIISFIIQLNPVAKDRMVNETITEMEGTYFKFLPYSKLHEEHYIGSLKMFIDKPIFGIGTNLFRFKCTEEKYVYQRSCTSHPHHYYLQIMAELGIIGFVFLLSFYFSLFFLIMKQFYNQYIRKKPKISTFSNFTIVLILFVFWWPIIPHMSFYNNWNNVFLMLPLGYFMKYLYGKE